MPYRNISECVYWGLCIDKGCPCPLSDHTERDPVTTLAFQKELDDERLEGEDDGRWY